MLRVIVVDDERLARQAMRQLLAEHKTTVSIVGEASSPKAAADLVRRERPDVVFLDIEMNTGTGFDLLREIPSPPLIVFVTAHSQFAAKAYDVAAVDYLLKPVQPKRLAATLARLVKAHRAARHQSLDPVIRVKTGDRTILLRADTILALCADKDYTSILSDRAPPILASQPLGALEALLPAPPFVRLDRSLVINMDRLREIETIDRSRTRIWFNGGAEGLLLGRTAAERLRRLQRPDRAANA